MIQLIPHHLYRSDFADVTELEERLERGSVGIIALDPSVECLPCDPSHSRQFRGGLVCFQIGCQVSEKRLPLELAAGLARGKQFVQYGDHPLLPVHLLFMVWISREASCILPKKCATRGTCSRLCVVGFKDHLSLLTTRTSIHQRASVAGTGGGDVKHPQKRLIQMPSLDPPFSQTQGTPGWRCP